VVTLNNYPAWKTWAWRLIRGAVATAAAQSLTLQVDWSNPEVAYKTIAISFISGFIMAVGVAVRDEFGGKDKSSVVHKLPV
jgi:hypothetical protein